MCFLLKMWAFVLPLWAYVLVGFCPRGFCPRGFCPRGFCPTLVGSSISEEQHDWPIEQAADKPDVQSLQEMRKPYNSFLFKFL